ncbi:hypothetical protein HDV05_000134, partial [Chytridiales sp. JEL 0842]
MHDPPIFHSTSASSPNPNIKLTVEVDPDSNKIGSRNPDEIWKFVKDLMWGICDQDLHKRSNTTRIKLLE